MINNVLKRDGTYQAFNKKKIADAIFKAAVACNGTNYEQATRLADEVEKILEQKFGDNRTPTVEQVQDIVEYELIENQHSQTAKAYILYREKRKRAREANALTGATIDLKTSVFFFSNSGRFSPLFCGAPAQITTMSALLQSVYSPE